MQMNAAKSVRFYVLVVWVFATLSMILCGVAVYSTLNMIALTGELETSNRFAGILYAERDFLNGDSRKLVAVAWEGPSATNKIGKVWTVRTRFDQILVDAYNEKKSELLKKAPALSSFEK